eukprot:1182717-Prorocentrum_minimum.AAC.2
MRRAHPLQCVGRCLAAGPVLQRAAVVHEEDRVQQVEGDVPPQTVPERRLGEVQRVLLPERPVQLRLEGVQKQVHLVQHLEAKGGGQRDVSSPIREVPRITSAGEEGEGEEGEREEGEDVSQSTVQLSRRFLTGVICPRRALRWYAPAGTGAAG